MHVIDLDGTTTDERLLAMHHCSPIHTYMFNHKGLLLQANNAALQSVRSLTGTSANP